jgi:hypothetical protein
MHVTINGKVYDLYQVPALIAALEQCQEALVELDHDLMEEALRVSGRTLRQAEVKD